MTIEEKEIVEAGETMETAEPQAILSWALSRFHPKVACACSFGAEDMCLVDMLSKINSGAGIFYLDTGVLFKETVELREKTIKKYGVTPAAYRPALSLDEQAKKYGPELWKKDPDLCCKVRKVEPLTRALSGLDAWITGMRREQSPTRSNIKVVEKDKKFGLVKVNPLARWTSKQVWDYIVKNGVPYNPLHDKGYPSIGCEPCTAQVKPGEDPRSGRWKDFEKKECGLHQ